MRAGHESDTRSRFAPHHVSLDLVLAAWLLGFSACLRQYMQLTLKMYKFPALRPLRMNAMLPKALLLMN